MERSVATNSACPVISENVISFSEVAVHLHMEGGHGLELSRGEFLIVRSVLKKQSENEKTTFSIIAKVGDDLRWPINRDVSIVKMATFHYSFSVEVPRSGADEGTGIVSETLNYVVVFKEEEELSSLKLLDKYLEKYACFSTDPPRVISKLEEQRRHSYKSVLAREISAGSQKLGRELKFCGSSYSSNLQKQTKALINSTNIKNQTQLTSSQREPTIPRYVSEALQRAKELTLKTDAWSEKALRGLLFANGAVIQTNVGKKALGTLPGETLVASMSGIGQVLGAALDLRNVVLSSTAEAATDIVASRFGEEAGRITGDVLSVAAHALGTVWNVRCIAKIICAAKSASTSGLQESGRASVEKRGEKMK